jgi:hypothetical protein
MVKSNKKPPTKLQSPWGSLSYYFLFLPAELLEKVRLALFSRQTVLGFTEIKNKHSAFQMLERMG